MNNQPVIVGIGEVLWDVFPDGARFGGAPANFLCSIAELAGSTMRPFLVSGVGQDELGARAVDALREHGVNTDHLTASQHPTGQVVVELDSHGHATYTFAADTAWDNLGWTPEFAPLAARADVVCFGTLGQRATISRETIQCFLRNTSTHCLRILDINLRPPFFNDGIIEQSLQLANALKLNDTELPVLARIFHLQGNERAMLRQLIERFSLRLVAYTRGDAGALLMEADGATSDLPSIPTEVVDTVGAGDSYTAALVLGMLRKQSLAAINAWGVRVAAFVCSQPGATPNFPLSIREPG